MSSSARMIAATSAVVIVACSLRTPVFFFSSRRRHTRYWRDWSSDVCSSDLMKICDKGIFLLPGDSINSADALVTNFHLPQSSLLLLVAAFAGSELILEAYRKARSEERRVGKESRSRWSPYH